jgi:hypothetical protein
MQQKLARPQRFVIFAIGVRIRGNMSIRSQTGRSSNGRTAVSGSAYRGSNPCLPAIHHSNYLIWFETGRSDLCRARGFSYKAMEEEDGALMVVAESYVRYKSPAFYEDVALHGFSDSFAQRSFNIFRK